MVDLSILVGVAGLIIQWWGGVSKSREKRLDHEHAIRLQKAQHQHELKLAKYRLRRTRSREGAAGEPLSRSGPLWVEPGTGEWVEKWSDPNDALTQRLRYEAFALHSDGFEVVYEPLGDGYGVALPVSGGDILAFWIPPSYPQHPPQVYLKRGLLISKIEFEAGSWHPSMTLAELVVACTEL